jgi:hypothetical protein
VSNFNSILNNPRFDRSKPTTFYIYGTNQSPLHPTVVAVKAAYLANGRQNFIVVGNTNLLLHVFDNAKVIADRFANNLLAILNSGYSISQVTLVAFSLGAKAIAPLTSRFITARSGGRFVLPRLVGEVKFELF